MVEGVPIPHLLPRWTLQRHPSLKNGLPASQSLQAAGCSIGMQWLMDCLGLLGWRDFLPPKGFKGAWDYWVVWAEETVALAKALQRCAVHSRMLPGVLCRAVQELCECLTYVIQSGNLFDLEILDVAEKDPMPLTPEGRASSPRVDPLVGVTTPSEPSTSEPVEAAPPEELALMPRWRPPSPPGLSLTWADEHETPQPEWANWPLSIPPGAPLDFTSLRSIQVTISHFPVMGEVHCKYQSQTMALASLTQAPSQLAQLEPLDPPDSEELWVNVMLFTYSMSDYSAPTHLRIDQECVVSLFMSNIYVSKHDEAFLILYHLMLFNPHVFMFSPI